MDCINCILCISHKLTNKNNNNNKKPKARLLLKNAYDAVCVFCVMYWHKIFAKHSLVWLSADLLKLWCAACCVMRMQTGYIKYSGCVVLCSEAQKQELEEVSHDAISHRLQQDEVSALKFASLLSVHAAINSFPLNLHYHLNIHTQTNTIFSPCTHPPPSLPFSVHFILLCLHNDNYKKL